jgi:hypothetical protein
MNYENTYLINRNSSTIKYTNKINNNYECYNFKKNLSFEKWINENENDNNNDNLIKNLEPNDMNIIYINCNNNTDTDNEDNNKDDKDNNKDDNNDDNKDDNKDDSEEKKNIIKVNVKFLNNLRINKWMYCNFEEDNVGDIEYKKN